MYISTTVVCSWRLFFCTQKPKNNEYDDDYDDENGDNM